MPTRHCLCDQETAHFASGIRRHWRLEEKPDVGTISRPGTFHGYRHMVLLTCRYERSHIFLPRSFVEVDSEKPARFVLQERIDTSHILTLKMIEDDLVRDGNKSLVGTITALDAWFVAYAMNPLVGAGR